MVYYNMLIFISLTVCINAFVKYVGAPRVLQHIAEKGRAGHKFSHAPQPMQRSVLIAGIIGADGLSGFELIIVMAAVGQ